MLKQTLQTNGNIAKVHTFYLHNTSLLFAYISVLFLQVLISKKKKKRKYIRENILARLQN